MEIRNDRQKGLSYTEIARKYHIDPRTAKKYAESETKPVYNLSNPKPSKLDPYKEQIRLWLEEAPYSAERIFEKIKEQGFTGGHSIVRAYVVVVKRLLRQEDSTLNRQFEDFAGFYGFKPVLCRPYRGQTKGKIERTVPSQQK